MSDMSENLPFILGAVVLYFLPSLMARNRKHHNHVAITLLNLLLGWTVIGWIAALVWAFVLPPPQPHLHIPTPKSHKDGCP